MLVSLLKTALTVKLLAVHLWVLDLRMARVDEKESKGTFNSYLHVTCSMIMCLPVALCAGCDLSFAQYLHILGKESAGGPSACCAAQKHDNAWPI